MFDFLKRIGGMLGGGGGGAGGGGTGGGGGDGGKGFPGGAGGNPKGAAEVMGHYSDGEQMSGRPATKDEWSVYWTMRQAGTDPAEARRTAGQVEAMPNVPNEPGPNAAGNVRAAPGYRPTGARRSGDPF